MQAAKVTSGEVEKAEINIGQGTRNGRYYECDALGMHWGQAPLAGTVGVLCIGCFALGTGTAGWHRWRALHWGQAPMQAHWGQAPMHPMRHHWCGTIGDRHQHVGALGTVTNAVTNARHSTLGR